MSELQPTRPARREPHRIIAGLSFGSAAIGAIIVGIVTHSFIDALGACLAVGVLWTLAGMIAMVVIAVRGRG